MSGQMGFVELPRAFAEFAVAREHAEYWVRFGEDPGVRIGDDIALLVGDRVFGFVHILLVERIDEDWIIHWEGDSLEFIN